MLGKLDQRWVEVVWLERQKAVTSTLVSTIVERGDS